MKEWFRNYGKVTTVIILFSGSLWSVFFLVLSLQPAKLKVSFFDVGQGDAIFIQTPSGHEMLIDGGPTNKILEQLGKHMSYFDDDIDIVVATHGDADHVTGLIPVLEKYAVDKIVVSPVESRTGIFDDLKKHIDNEGAEIHTAQISDVIDFHDGVIATILYPTKNYREKKNDTNDASVSMVLSYGNNTFLLTGDLPSTREPQLLTKDLPKNITVYKAGHHGSKYSSGEILLKYIRPEYTALSVGKDNRYGHPNSEVIERLQKYTKEILSTMTQGTISFITDGRLIEVKTSK